MSTTTEQLFKGKRITFMGLGLLGRGVGDVRFLASQGAILTVTDLKTREQLAPSLEALKDIKNITYILGQHRVDDFQNKDMIIKAAGVPLDSPYIAEAKKNHIPVHMSTSLFAQLTPATIVGVTGTRGKSTVTHLLYEILKEAYKDSKHKVYLGGNIKGVSTLEFLPQTQKGDVVVMELDSWQLQGFGEAHISPHVAIFTTFFDDHLNYYNGDTKKYLQDKSYIYSAQKEGDILIIGKQMAHLVSNSPVTPLSVDEKCIPATWKLRMPGKHNRYNAALAVAAAQAMGVKKGVIRRVVAAFEGVAGRLQLVRSLHGIDFYNDTTATTPEATIAALEALGKKTKKKHINLIMGGANKSLNMLALYPALKRYAKTIICLPGTGTDRIMKDQVFLDLKPIATPSLEDALHTAQAYATIGDSILLSPAFASFGLFVNEFDRGEQFDSLVKKLK